MVKSIAELKLAEGRLIRLLLGICEEEVINGREPRRAEVLAANASLFCELAATQMVLVELGLTTLEKIMQHKNHFLANEIARRRGELAALVAERHKPKEEG